MPPLLIGSVLGLVHKL